MPFSSLVLSEILTLFSIYEGKKNLYLVLKHYIIKRAKFKVLDLFLNIVTELP